MSFKTLELFYLKINKDNELTLEKNYNWNQRLQSKYNNKNMSIKPIRLYHLKMTNNQLKICECNNRNKCLQTNWEMRV